MIINKILIWVTVDHILMTLTMKCRGLLIMLDKCILFPGLEIDPWWCQLLYFVILKTKSFFLGVIPTVLSVFFQSIIQYVVVL